MGMRDPPRAIDAQGLVAGTPRFLRHRRHGYLEHPREDAHHVVRPYAAVSCGQLAA